MQLKTVCSMLSAALFYFSSQAYAAGSIAVMQFNLHNVVFTNGDAYKESDLMNQGDSQHGITQYDIITTEENSTPDQSPRNLLNYGLSAMKYALCGTIQDASLFYNSNRFRCDHTVSFDVTPNVGPGAGPRRVTVGVLVPKTAGDPTILAATSHWCVPWGQSTCAGGSTQAAHDKDAAIFADQLNKLMAQYPKAVVIFGGDLNSMSAPESVELVGKMQSYGYDTGNPYDASHKLIPSMGTGTPDLVFYRKTSLDKSTTLTLNMSYLNLMQGLSDHRGAIISKFTY